MALIETRSGCKVGWSTYDDEAEARAAGQKARVEAAAMAQRGYDFGYQSPGSVEQVRTYPHQTAEGGTDYSRPEYEQAWVVTTP